MATNHVKGHPLKLIPLPTNSFFYPHFKKIYILFWKICISTPSIIFGANPQNFNLKEVADG
jgi:hypothetical protein